MKAPPRSRIGIWIAAIASALFWCGAFILIWTGISMALAVMLGWINHHWDFNIATLAAGFALFLIIGAKCTFWGR